MGKRLLACFMAAVLAFPSYGVFAETSAENEKTETVIEQEDSSGRQASDDFDIDEITSDGSDEDAVAGSSSEDADIEDAEYVSPEEEQEETDEEETADAEEAEEEIVEVDGEAHTASDEAMNAEGDGEDPGVEEGTEEPDPEADIPDDATYWCGHYYKSYSSVGISPDSARAACESMGGYLATFTSKAELTFLSNYLDNSTPYTSIYNVDYIINSVSDLGDNYLQWPTGETYRYGDGYVYSRFLGENGPSTSGTGQSVLHHIRYNNTDGNATYWGRENYNKLLTTIDSLTGKPKLDVRGYVCEWGPTQMELTAEDMSLDTEVYRYSSSTSSYKPNVTVKYNVVSETLEKNNDYLLQYIRNSSP